MKAAIGHDFVILGGNMLLKGVCDRLHEMGYRVIVVDWNDQPAVTGDLHIQEDVKDTAKVLEVLSPYQVDGVFTCIDLAVPTVNAVHRQRGLQEMPESFREVLTKNRMRECWMRDGLFNRISLPDGSFGEEEILSMNSRMKLIVKPDIAASSRGITILEKSSDAAHLRQALDKARRASFDGRCLVEEFAEGREFTIDMLGDAQGHVSVYGISVKYHTVNALHNRVATKLHWNSSAYPEEVYERLADAGKRCYRSLGMAASYGHLEMILREDGSLSPVEIGARSSGFIASHLVPAASGCDYLADYIRVIHGESIEERDHIGGNISSMWFGYDLPSGCDSVCPSNLAKFLDPRIQVMYSKRDGLTAPRHFGAILDDTDRDAYGYEMLCGPKSVLTVEHVQNAEHQFLNEFIDNYQNKV